MTSDYIPLIDLTPVRSGDPAGTRDAARRMNEALEQSGFIVVSGHGVPEPVIAETVAAMETFFALPMDEKMAIRSTAKGSPRGYIPFGLETLAITSGETVPPDLKEGFGMGPYWLDERDGGESVGQSYTPNVWPEDTAFRETVEQYYRAMEGLTAVLMELFAVAMDLDSAYFVDRFTTHNSTLRLFHYPPLTQPPEPGQLRAGAHTDYGALTILLAQNRPGGLQVRLPDGRWTDAEAPPGTFVINIGDLMMTWSNDRWLSNSHRVVNPPSEDIGEASRRYSIAYFCNPNDDLLIECIPTSTSGEAPPKYAPFLAKEHRLKKIEMSKGSYAG